MAESIEPPNFSWVEQGSLAALASPNLPAHYQYLVNHGITYLLSLTISKPEILLKESSIQVFHIPIVDFSAPSLSQIEDFMTYIDKAKKQNKIIAVNCQKGKGRTGTMLACYLVRKHKMTAKEAIKEIRRLRPDSVETREQENAIEAYAKYLKARAEE